MALRCSRTLDPFLLSCFLAVWICLRRKNLLPRIGTNITTNPFALLSLPSRAAPIQQPVCSRRNLPWRNNPLMCQTEQLFTSRDRDKSYVALQNMANAQFRKTTTRRHTLVFTPTRLHWCWQIFLRVFSQLAEKYSTQYDVDFKATLGLVKSSIYKMFISTFQDKI